MPRASAGYRTRVKPAPVEDVSRRGRHTLQDVADLVLVQGYTREYAYRKTEFTKDQIDRFLDYQEKLHA